MSAKDAWLQLRSSCAEPPGAAATGRRNRLYVACILQFEQLVNAAAVVAPHARPLPLYYAAMHGAKALAAAFGADESPTGHGLRQASAPVPPDVMAFEIEPRGKASVLSELCQLTRSSKFVSPVSLADLFLSLPELAEKPHDLAGARALYVEELPDESQYPIPDPFQHILVESRELPPAEPRARVYPSLNGWDEGSPYYSPITTRGNPGAHFRRAVDPRDRLQALEDVAPLRRHACGRWLVPTIRGADGILSPLVAWYALLNGFSVLARYEPDTWVDALDVRQRHAVAIEAALDEATTALPGLVWRHISTELAEADVAASSGPDES